MLFQTLGPKTATNNYFSKTLGQSSGRNPHPRGGHWVGGALVVHMGLLCASSRVALATSGVQLGKRVVEQQNPPAERSIVLHLASLRQRAGLILIG